MTRKEFHISDVLSITTGQLVSTRHMEGVYDILNYMTDSSLWTHQLPKAADLCAPYLLRQHPGLEHVEKVKIHAVDDALILDERNGIIDTWLKQQITKFGEYLMVEPVPLDDALTTDPTRDLPRGK